jgi:hypothetical protein
VLERASFISRDTAHAFLYTGRPGIDGVMHRNSKVPAQ